VLGALLALPTCFPAWAHAQAAAATADDDNPAIEKITTLNKKALDAYNDLEFEEARKILKQALDLCASAGLDNHPVAARTHIHMGVVLIAAKQQDLGLKQFRKAIEIQPDIQVTKALANPEILQAFKEAGATSAEPPAGGGDQAGPSGAAPTGPAQLKGMQHRAIGRGVKGKAIPIVVAIGDDVTGYTKVLLEYRPEGVAEFREVEMKKAGNRYSAEIPASATQGSLVSYYIEADPDNDDAEAIATSGTEDHPYNVSLVAPSGNGEGGGGCAGGDCEEEEAGPPIFLGLMGGTGFGFVSGSGEINTRNNSSGFAMAGAAQITPEVGYFLGPRFRLSLQLRYQILSSTTPLNLDKYLTDAQKKANPDYKTTLCGGDGLCSTQTGSAVAVLARATWFFGADLFRPYFSLALGAGYIRHEVTFDSLGKVCGTNGTETCVDTVLAGPVFAGPGAGVLFAITPKWGVLADVTSLLGFPKFTYNFDLNVGVSVRL
jgi:tetratricopeptide (TPR) repeat protein